MSSPLPIGIFDSGVGGLSVLRHIREILPAERLIYVADRQHIPYGNKSHDFIKQRATLITEFLLRQDAKAIVVACNTATAAAINTLRKNYKLPILGMEPGIKPAMQLSRNGMIGVLATEGTLDSGKFKGLIERHANGAELFIRPCHGWVEEVESGDVDSPGSDAMVRKTLAPLLEKGVDTLVLGCTHYPFLQAAIRRTAGEKIHVVDTGFAVASHLKRRLQEEQLLNDSPSEAGEQFWCSGPVDEMQRLTDRLWGAVCQVSSLPG